MKKTTKLLAAAAGVVIVLLSVGFGMMKVQAGDNGSDVVIVDVHQNQSSTWGPSVIIVSHGNQKTERIETGSLKDKNWESNADKLNSVLDKIVKSGFEIATVTSFVELKENKSEATTTYVLKRK